VGPCHPHATTTKTSPENPTGLYQGEREGSQAGSLALVLLNKPFSRRSLSCLLAKDNPFKGGRLHPKPRFFAVTNWKQLKPKVSIFHFILSEARPLKAE
jgi:hypothetical protein